MYGSSATAEPTGRWELLLWINSVCTAQYPSVESLRDGVAYCTIIDAAASRVAENCASLALAEANIAQARAKRASRLLSRMEWNVTIVTCTNQDPSLDTMLERGHCEKNMQTLQLMLRGCVPPEFSLEINVSRLATGKLQEHIGLLKWMYQFLKKMLNIYSRSALERRNNMSEGSGSVEGVRMTRAMRLQQKMVREKYKEPELLGFSPTDETNITETGNNNMREEVQIQQHSKQAEENTVGHRNYFHVTESATAASIKEGNDTLSRSPVKHHECTHTQGSHLTVPLEYVAILEDLRQDIESYEAATLAAHRRHQEYLTGVRHEKGEYSPRELFLNEKLLPKKASIISLEHLGVLLEERDKLWQALEVHQDAILRTLADLKNKNQGSKSSSPLLQKILLALSPLKS